MPLFDSLSLAPTHTTHSLYLSHDTLPLSHFLSMSRSVFLTCSTHRNMPTINLYFLFLFLSLSLTLTLTYTLLSLSFSPNHPPTHAHKHTNYLSLLKLLRHDGSVIYQTSSFCFNKKNFFVTKLYFPILSLKRRKKFLIFKYFQFSWNDRNSFFWKNGVSHPEKLI